MPDPPPDWRRHTVDGMAPMMSPDQIERALAAHGYRPRDCGGDKVVPDALRRSDDLICYEAPAKRLNAIMYFANLSEGRRLASLQLHETGRNWSDRAGTRANYARFLQTLTARWGPPDSMMGTSMKMRSWTVPGGSPTLPDYVSSTESEVQGRNIDMKSYWAVSRDVATGLGKHRAVDQ